MNPAQRKTAIDAFEEYVEETQSEICVLSFYDFLKEFWGEIVKKPLVDNWHIKALCDEMQTVGEWVIRGETPEYDHLLINIPPGMSKSTICSILFPAWLWINNPQLQIISSSYSIEASLPHSKASRVLMKGAKFQKWYGHLFEFSRDQDAASYYANSKQGKRITTSSGGTITGKHADVIIVDDAHKPPDIEKQEYGDSPAVIAAQVAWHWSTLDSRKTDEGKTPTITIMQRLHDQDLSGDIIAKAQQGGLTLRHVKLPAELLNSEVSPPEYADLYEGGILDPIRKGPDVLRKKRVNMGSVMYATQYLQDTSPSEGGVIKKGWYGYYTPSDLPKDCIVCCSIDSAMGDKSRNRKPGPTDPYGVLFWTVYGAKVYLIHYLKCTLEVPDFIRLLQTGPNNEVLRRRYPDQMRDVLGAMAPGWRESIMAGETLFKALGFGPNSVIIIENQSSGVPIRQTLRDKEFPFTIIGSNTGTVSKVDRMKLQAPKIEGGRVLLPTGEIHFRRAIGKDEWVERKVEPWVPEFIDKTAAFPNTSINDEEVDTLEIALRHGLK